uniref:tumor necrosis factor receptor superfamily member 14-like isoform X6 n=1 Tax=Myodes glareolus TaxID=447135 RepID=UPI002020FC43|nr:tumor necrosis factor receptor superfamily member 14-like isoform X6 [Myodes glareolus]
MPSRPVFTPGPWGSGPSGSWSGAWNLCQDGSLHPGTRPPQPTPSGWGCMSSFGTSCPVSLLSPYAKRRSILWGTTAAPCASQTYTAHANGLSECLSCGICDPDMGLVTWRECSSREDTVCRCIPGYFCETQEGDHCTTCLPLTNCSLGQRVLERGCCLPPQRSENYVLEASGADRSRSHPRETQLPANLSPEFSACLSLTLRCDAWYLREAEHGTSSTDVTCSFSGLFYFAIFCPISLVFILVVVTIVIYVRRKTSHTRPAARELEPLQRQKQHNTVKLPVAEVGPAEEETAFNRVSSG